MHYGYGDWYSQASGFPDALEDAHLLSRPDGVAKVLSVLSTALRSSTNSASKTHLLNTVRTSALMTQHVSAFFTRIPAERTPQRQRIQARAIKVPRSLTSLVDRGGSRKKYWGSVLPLPDGLHLACLIYCLFVKDFAMGGQLDGLLPFLVALL